MRPVFLALALAAAPLAVQAAELPRPGAADPRIQWVDYDPDQVVLLRGVLGYQLMLEFGDGERIENVSIGDSLGWQVTPNRKASLLFLKPLDKSAATNMTVVTNLRRYAFELAAAAKAPRPGDIAYVVRFRYPATPVVLPPPPPPDAPPAEQRNAGYQIAGSAAASPAQVFDDGRSTYFQWSQETATPAIFALSAEGGETLVNSTVRGPYTVVDQLAGGFVLRNGKEVATVTRPGAAVSLKR
jgi:type IV secretion system protein VirB9